ncbi:CKLF8 protein, partial [Polypterus senegalus]|nr:CKLF8 protein [Polypterus senegalus]
MIVIKLRGNVNTLCSFWSYTLPSSNCFFYIFQIFGLLVWMLVAGTEYFRVPAFGWVMFIAVFYWILTVFFLILYLTMAYTKITQVPWTTVGLCFNCSAFVLYFTAAVVEATSIKHEFARRHDFNSWAASSVRYCALNASHSYFSIKPDEVLSCQAVQSQFGRPSATTGLAPTTLLMFAELHIYCENKAFIKMLLVSQEK